MTVDVDVIKVGQFGATCCAFFVREKKELPVKCYDLQMRNTIEYNWTAVPRKDAHHRITIA